MTKKHEKLVEEILVKDFLKSGCFYKKTSGEGRTAFNFKWDFYYLNIYDRYSNGLTAIAGGPAVSILLERLDNLIFGYHFSSLEEFEAQLLKIKDTFLSKGLPIIQEKIAEMENSGLLIDWELIKTLQHEKEIFFDKYDKEDLHTQYKIIWDPWQGVGNINQLGVDRYIEFYKKIQVSAAIFGEWIIRTQGGRWKVKQTGFGLNGFVLVSPDDMTLMVKLDDLFEDRLRRNLVDLECRYAEDSAFWQNNSK